jgi:hypothetical protein
MIMGNKEAKEIILKSYDAHKQALRVAMASMVIHPRTPAKNFKLGEVGTYESGMPFDGGSGNISELWGIKFESCSDQFYKDKIRYSLGAFLKECSSVEIEQRGLAKGSYKLSIETDKFVEITCTLTKRSEIAYPKSLEAVILKLAKDKKWDRKNAFVGSIVYGEDMKLKRCTSGQSKGTIDAVLNGALFNGIDPALHLNVALDHFFERTGLQLFEPEIPDDGAKDVIVGFEIWGLGKPKFWETIKQFNANKPLEKLAGESFETDLDESEKEELLCML